MGAVAVISVLDQSDTNAHICAAMPSGSRLRQITISLMTAYLFTYRSRSSLNRRTAACWSKSSAPKFNQPHMEAKQSSENRLNVYCLAGFLHLFLILLISNFLFFSKCVYTSMQVVHFPPTYSTI